MTLPQQQISSSNTSDNMTTTTTPSTVAAGQVFALPELVEKILEYAAPASLYGLRRVNATFNYIISLKKFQRPMLITPIGRLSIMRLVRVLQSSQVRRAVDPFAIGDIHTRNGGRDLMVNVRMRHDWKPTDPNSKGAAVTASVPCQKQGSWRHMKVEGGGKPVILLWTIRDKYDESKSRCRSIIKEWQSTDEVTLGDLVDECMKQKYPRGWDDFAS